MKRKAKQRAKKPTDAELSARFEAALKRLPGATSEAFPDNEKAFDMKAIVAAQSKRSGGK